MSLPRYPRCSSRPASPRPAGCSPRTATGTTCSAGSPSRAARLRASPGEAQRELRAFDKSLLIERPRPLALGSVQALPVPGRCAVGDRELELHPADGHTPDGMAIVIPWARVLV